jgi:RNA polymerase sigma-70 factor (ECF subfamily)
MAIHEIELKARMIKGLDGDAAAYQSLLRMLVPQLRSFFGRRVGRDDVVEDLVQETLIAIHTRRVTFDRERPFSAWLYAIARYKLADHFRRLHRSQELDELDENMAAAEFESAALASIDVERLLDTLPAKQSNAIRAIRIEGFALEEVAETAGISHADAKMSVYRGLKRLSARVQGKGR